MDFLNPFAPGGRILLRAKRWGLPLSLAAPLGLSGRAAHGKVYAWEMKTGLG